MGTNSSQIRLGDAVRNYRQLLRAKQTDITERGGPSDATIRNLERYVGKPVSRGTLIKLDRGLGWPQGTALKILDGDADVIISHENGIALPVLVDYTADSGDQAGGSVGDSEACRSTESLASEPTSELLTELAARYRGQEERIRELKRENAALREGSERRQTSS